MIPEDWQQQLEQLHTAGYGWALGRCGWNREEAEEVLQMTYLKILEGKAKFNSESSFKTWFFALIRLTAADYRRKAFFRRIGLSRILSYRSIQPPNAHPQDQAEELEEHRRIVRLLKSLPNRQQEILELVFYQDLTIEEAAAVMGVAVGTARTHYERGKKRLREKLETEAIKSP